MLRNRRRFLFAAFGVVIFALAIFTSVRSRSHGSETVQASQTTATTIVEPTTTLSPAAPATVAAPENTASAVLSEGIATDSPQPAEHVDRQQVVPPSTLVPPDPEARPDLIAADLEATYNARFCVAGHESMSSGLYDAEYGNNPGSRDGSDASGAYQFLNKTWRTYLPWTESYYHITLTGPDEEAGRSHAAYASPFAQDLVAAFALHHVDLAQGQHPWPYRECWGQIGSSPNIHDSFPVEQPTEFIYDQYIGQDVSNLFALSY